MNLIGAPDTATGEYFSDGVDVSMPDAEALGHAAPREDRLLCSRASTCCRGWTPGQRRDAVGYARAARRTPRVRGRAGIGRLGTRMHHRPNELSGGQPAARGDRPRAGQPSADPDADEPTGALTAQDRREILALFELPVRRRPHRDPDHHDAQVAAHADRVYVMHERAWGRGSPRNGGRE